MVKTLSEWEESCRIITFECGNFIYLYNKKYDDIATPENAKIVKNVYYSY